MNSYVVILRGSFDPCCTYSTDVNQADSVCRANTMAKDNFNLVNIPTSTTTILQDSEKITVKRLNLVEVFFSNALRGTAVADGQKGNFYKLCHLKILI